MKVLIIVPPILKRPSDGTSIITIPPLGYGGIELVVYSLINGLIRKGCIITLIGAPGSYSSFGLDVVRGARDVESIRNWVSSNYKEFDIVHDHSCGLVFGKDYKLPKGVNFIGTHHRTGASCYPRNTVFLSDSQKKQAKDKYSPVIRLPVVFDNYIYNEAKKDYYLYMGRVSNWKGVQEAAQFCQKLSANLYIAGPIWEKEYFENIMHKYGSIVSYVGEVSGLKKIELLSEAKGVFALSRPLVGPWGEIWCEPGSTIVGEAAASGTAIISSKNGCLKEIVTPSIGIQLEENEINTLDTSKLIKEFPLHRGIYNYAKENWDHIKISSEYIALYERIMDNYYW